MISFSNLTAPNPCENSPGMDVAFLLDRTKSLSIPDFMMAKGFLGQLVTALNISREGTHVGLILFANKGKVYIKFDNEKYYNKDDLYEFVQDLPHDRFMPTRIDRALLAANNTLFVPEGGDREGFPNVLIILTDGRTHPNSQPFVEIVPSLEVSLFYAESTIRLHIMIYVEIATLPSKSYLKETSGQCICMGQVMPC